MGKIQKKSFALTSMLTLAVILTTGCTKPNDDNYNGDWVDLGLPSGLLWATRNVGASSPEGHGDYFAWGETTTKDVYNWGTYHYCTEHANGELTITKYTDNDGLTILQPSDDAATANYGGRIPTYSEWQELISNTTSQWTTQNEVYGFKFTGSNGKSIFLPAAGSRWDNLLNLADSDGNYWSSSLNTGYPYNARVFNFGSSYQSMSGNNRGSGCSVRAVRSAQ